LVPEEPEIVGWTRQLAINLKRLRSERNWSTRQLAREAGVNADTVSELERAVRSNINVSTVLRLQGAFQLYSIEQLLGEPPAMPSRRHAEDLLEEDESTSGAA
jgi:transcriptional regulator with XRE-family HTH domain